MKSWINIPKDSDFTIYNLPFGVFSTSEKSKRVGIAIGNNIIDLLVCNRVNIFEGLTIDDSIFENDYLNEFINLGKNKTNRIREVIQNELCNDQSAIT